MTTLESDRSIHFGSPAMLLGASDDREVAWAEKHVVRNEAYRWILGRFVEADNPNENGHVFPLEELKAAEPTIRHAPLNMLHRSHHVVGSFVATEMVYPVAATAAEEQLHPYIESLAAFWRYNFEDECYAVEKAHKEGSLYLSMEAIPKALGCIDAACAEREYAYEGRQSPNYCAHLNEAGTVRKLIQPHFVGGALIIPPTQPGWKKASVTQMSKLIHDYAEEAETIYDDLTVELPHLDAAEWESIMAMVLVQTVQQEEGKFTFPGKKKDAGPPAMPDGSFSIKTAGDLKKAIAGVGKAKDATAAKAHIIKRAKALGFFFLLPKDWR